MASKRRTSRGSYILPNGQRITISEQKALRNLVNRVNRRTKRIIEKRPKDLVKTKYNMFSESTDWLLRKKSARLSRFKNKTEFNRYISSLRDIASGKAERRRNVKYFENYKKALRNAFNSKSRELVTKVNKIGVDKLSEALVRGEIETEIGYVYSKDQEDKVFNKISTALDNLIE